MSNATGTGATGGEGVAINETDRLISSDKVEGTPVYTAPASVSVRSTR